MKIFDTSRINKKILRQFICLVAKEHKVSRVSFNNQAKNVAGLYDFTKNSIFLNNKQTKKRLLCVFFHELAHHEAVMNNVWIDYHSGNMEDISPLHQFNIENQIDKIASSLWNKYVNTKKWGKYKFSYPKSNKKHLTTWLNHYHQAQATNEQPVK